MKFNSSALTRLMLYSAAALYGLTFWGRPPIDPDLGWHLAGGQWISAHGAVPGEDFINSFNLFWHDYHWLGQFLLYRLYAAGGYQALQLSLGLVCAGIGLTVVRLCLGQRNTVYLKDLVCVAFSLLFLDRVGMIRPQMIALLFLGLSQILLAGKPGKFEIPVLFAAACVLANVHVYWVFVPLLWFFYRCLPDMARKKSLPGSYAVYGFLFLSAAGFVSPYGISDGSHGSPGPLANYLLLIEYLATADVLKGRIGEFQGSLYGWGITSLAVFAVVILFIRTFRAKRALADLGNFSAAALSLLLSVLAVKFVPFLAILGVRYFSTVLSGRLRATKYKALLKGGIPALTTLVACFFLLRAYAVFPPKDESWEQGAAFLIPFGTCRKAADLQLYPAPGRDHVRMLTYFDHGGWCYWLMQQQRPGNNIKVTTDNRTQWVPAQHYEMSFDMYYGQYGWWQTLASWDPDLALTPTPGALFSLLSLMPGKWKVEYQDPNYTLFSRKRG